MRGIAGEVKQDVLLLAVANDHFVPIGHLYRLMEELTGARSLAARVFTERKGGEQHCQVGNRRLATEEMTSWLDCVYVKDQVVARG